MNKSAPVVVGTDGSPCADRAVEWAAAEAVRRRRPLHIVHAVQPWAYGVGFPSPPLSDSLATAGEHILSGAAELAGKAGTQLEITTELVFDGPAYALRARAERAFEIVVGHRGLGGFTGLLLGSTSLRVAGHTHGPVIVVRGVTGEERREVLVGIDPSEESAGALDYAFEAASIRGSWIRAVHVGPEPRTMFDGVTLLSIRDAVGAIQEHLGQAVAPWRAKFPDIMVIEEGLVGQPVTELVERSQEADLLVVGSRRHGACLHLGAVSHGLVHHADCPVAVIGHHI